MSSRPAFRPSCMAAKDFSHCFNSARRFVDFADKEARVGESRTDIAISCCTDKEVSVVVAMFEAGSFKAR